MSYAKLFSSITESSLWSEPKEVRLLFVTMLAKANSVGFVEASKHGLARAANLAPSEVYRAIKILEHPDPDSKNPDCEGRRVIPAPGGWIVLNYEDYRNRQSEEERREYMREYMRRYRGKRKQPVNSVKKSKDFPSASASASYLEGLKGNPLYAGINIEQEMAFAKDWCQKRGRRFTERFFDNWLKKADRDVVIDCKPKKPYGNNYLAPAREPTEAELEQQREIARIAKEKLAAELNKY